MKIINIEVRHTSTFFGFTRARFIIVIYSFLFFSLPESIAQTINTKSSHSIDKTLKQSGFRRIIGLGSYNDYVFVASYFLDKNWTPEMPHLVHLKVHKYNLNGEAVDSLVFRNPAKQGINFELAQMAMDGMGKIYLSFFQSMTSNDGMTIAYSHNFEKIWSISEPYLYINSFSEGLVCTPPNLMSSSILIYKGDSQKPIKEIPIKMTGSYPVIANQLGVFMVLYDPVSKILTVQNLIDYSVKDFKVGEIDFNNCNYSINSNYDLALTYHTEHFRSIKEGKKPRKVYDFHLAIFDSEAMINDTIIYKDLKRPVSDKSYFGQPVGKYFCLDNGTINFFDNEINFIKYEPLMYKNNNKVKGYYYSEQAADQNEKIFLTRDKSSVMVISIKDE